MKYIRILLINVDILRKIVICMGFLNSFIDLLRYNEVRWNEKYIHKYFLKVDFHKNTIISDIQKVIYFLN